MVDDWRVPEEENVDGAFVESVNTESVTLETIDGIVVAVDDANTDDVGVQISCEYGFFWTRASYVVMEEDTERTLQNAMQESGWRYSPQYMRVRFTPFTTIVMTEAGRPRPVLGAMFARLMPATHEATLEEEEGFVVALIESEKTGELVPVPVAIECLSDARVNIGEKVKVDIIWGRKSRVGVLAKNIREV